MNSKNNILNSLRYLPLLALLILPFTSFGQLNPEGLTRYSEKEGLTSESVNALIVDNKGYVWIGTPNGLSRFDGYEFKNFFSNPIDSTAIQGMLIYSLFEDSKDRIWMGTNPNYLEVYDPVKKTFKAYNYSPVVDPLNGNNPLYGYRLFSILEDSGGRIYFTVVSFNDAPWLLYLDPDDNTIKKFKGPDGSDLQGVYSIFKDQSGKIWLGTDKGIFTIEADDTLVPVHVFDKIDLKNDYPVDLVFTNDHHVWILTVTSKLIDFDMESQTYKIWTSDLLIKINDEPVIANTMIFDELDTFWLGTDHGVYYFKRKNSEFGTFNNTLKTDIENPIVSKFAIDHFGDLWIGTYNKGLFRYEAKPEFISFTSEQKDNALTEGWTNSIVEAKNGDVWIHNNGGLNHLDLQALEITTFPNTSLPAYAVNFSSLWAEGNGIAMAVFGDGKNYYTFDSGQVEKGNLTGVPDHTTIIKHLTDSKGNIWLGTGAGLYRKEKSGKGYQHYEMNNSTDSVSGTNRINQLFESKKHGLWIITDLGLYLYDYEKDRIERHGADKSEGDVFLTQDVNSFYEDDQGVAWVGLWQGGLARYNVEKKEIKTYALSDGLPSMSVQGILGDEKNKTIWLSTFNGISRFDKTTEKYNNFSIMDGIQGSQFSDGAYLTTSEGLMIFGGSNGITLFDPDKIETDYHAPEVFLTDLKIFNKSVLPGEGSVLDKPIDQTQQIVLGHDENDLSIQYIGLHYSNPIKNKYAVKLENYDDDWRPVGSLNEAFYPNLSPGTYIFKVKAANDKGVWSEERQGLKIVINPPWWRTWWAYGSYLMFLIFLGWRLHRFQRNRVIRMERERMRQRELEQAKEIEKAYKELKATQAQLIHSEKMASLGELTAGIAHEIQNPLNFVNNFADVSTELIDEMNEELDKGQLDEVKLISTDLRQNMEKITHHGKRADAIVKGMLQHSRSSSGTKEPTDINALADEYLRLSYHGLRAKDKSFNADFNANLDESLPKINVVPQDMGRVLLNLITNAFYAVNERSKMGVENYEPKVEVMTRRAKDAVEILVSDNGNGMRDHVKEKVFQPFFTTKPTGQGTGLGLSLSYDIIKAHGGEIIVESKEGEGTEFIIKLPSNRK